MSSKYWHEASSAESCNAEVLTKEPPKPCKTRPAATNYVSSSSSDDDSVDRPEAKYLPRRIDNKRQKKPLQSIANRLMKSPSHTMSTPLGVRGKAYIGLPKMVCMLSIHGASCRGNDLEPFYEKRIKNVL